MTSSASRFLSSLVACAVVGGCSPAALKPEHHELRPVAQEFGVVAPALPQALAVLGLQVAERVSVTNTITVTAVTPEGVRVEITLGPGSPGGSSLDVHGQAEQQALAQLATRLAEALAAQVAQNGLAPERQKELEQLGYIANESEPAEQGR